MATLNDIARQVAGVGQGRQSLLEGAANGNALSSTTMHRMQVGALLWFPRKTGVLGLVMRLHAGYAWRSNLANVALKPCVASLASLAVCEACLAAAFVCQGILGLLGKLGGRVLGGLCLAHCVGLGESEERTVCRSFCGSRVCSGCGSR